MSTFLILTCSDDPQYFFGESGPETLTSGQTWAFSGASGEIICGTVVEESPGVANFTAATNYDSCGPCLEAYLDYFSANTEYTLCMRDCDGNPITLYFPHPVWSGQYGSVVTQLNSVQLGGTNGLYN